MKKQTGLLRHRRNLKIKKNCSNFKMITKKKTKRKKKNSVSLMLMENLEDAKTLKKKNLKDSLSATNPNGSST
jgi:hypothetical protein